MTFFSLIDFPSLLVNLEVAHKIHKMSGAVDDIIGGNIIIIISLNIIFGLRQYFFSCSLRETEMYLKNLTPKIITRETLDALFL